jgi:predicted CXXCH cytochrome family protein
VSRPRAALLAIGLLAACGQERSAPPAPPSPTAAPAPAPEEPAFVGAARCAACHAAEATAWRGSHHDRAMEEPSEASVAGDFADARFEHAGVASRFFRRGGRYLVETEGSDGKPAEFEVAWTFGVEPLQQYLVRFPGGRVQALGVAWDARPREAGGQRWFSLHPDERIPPGDVLHWTGPAQRWNVQCADCHSTDLRRGYDAARDAYDTSWAELDVACEACHGPGAAHVAWAEAAARGEPGAADRGLTVRFAPARHEDWVLDPGAPIARLGMPRGERTELETCAPCHARRSLLREGSRPGEPFLDAFRPALLDEGLYEADGQMRDEVYVHGSFLQSRMYAAGVTCSDCHDPHSLRLRAEGNALCGQCHRAEVFDAPAHHRHAAGSPGAACVSCHMPARTYMVVDVRHDHSFRVPRPDLSVAIGTPNACTDCHADRAPAWAADAVARWFPHGRSGTPHYGEALAAGRAGLPGADRALAAFAADQAQPGIARATALSLLERPGPEALRRAAADPDPLVRLGALEAAARAAPAERLGAVRPLLRDPLRAVRIEAARTLADVPPSLWVPAERAALADALAEYRAAQRAQADRPEPHVNLALLHLALGEPAAARREYETALRLAPWFVPAAANLADLERAEGNDAGAEALLRRALASAPESAELHHALGLALVRSGRRAEALAELERAVELAPAQVRFAYVLAVALNDAGEGDRALAVLSAAHQRRPGDREVLAALATLSIQAGHREEAIRYARALADAAPDDPEARALLTQLEGDPAR